MKKTTVKTTSPLCPITRVATLLSDKWTMLIMHSFLDDLNNTEKRFCELEQLLKPISTRTLTNKLKILISEDLLEKTNSGYIITKRGKGLSLIEEAMRQYEKKFLQ